MTPNSIILGGLVVAAGASFALGVYKVGKVALGSFIDGIKEENREYQRELAKP